MFIYERSPDRWCNLTARRRAYGNHSLLHFFFKVVHRRQNVICWAAIGVETLQLVSRRAAKWSGIHLSKMYGRRRQWSPPSPSPPAHPLFPPRCASHSHRGNNNKNKKSHISAGNVRNMFTKCTPSCFLTCVLLNVRERERERSRGRVETFLGASTSSQWVSGWAAVFCSPLGNHQCKTLPVPAFII